LNFFLLYLLLLKATLTSFSGLASLPMIRTDFVVQRHLLTDRQLSTAVVAGQTGPGPVGLYIVSVGYFVSGVPGAIAAMLAVITPAFLAIPLMRWAGARAESPRVRSAIRGVLLAGAGLLLSASMPLARDAITGALHLAILAVSLVLLTFTRIQTAWVMLGAAGLGLVAKVL
jgi:chromate transporter